jgi:predicted metal-binding membrane protein
LPSIPAGASSVRGLDRARIALVGALVALAATAWLVTDDRMDGMEMGGLELGGLGFYVVTWVVMMAAMMFPSIAPVVAVYDRLREGRRVPVAGTVLFVCGYLVAWTAVGLLAYGTIELVRSLSIDWLAWDRAGRYVAGGTILAAAAYQLTPLKDVCLRHCRSPMSFVLNHWRDGALGALRMGIGHGSWCVGCCWALMAALFAVGAMSLGWMAFVAGLIALEKLWPWKTSANLAVAAVLLALGVGVMAVPDSVPGLMTDDSMSHDGGGGAMQMDRGGSMGGDSMDRGDSMP